MYIYSFHMPAYILISGYLSHNVEKRRETAFVTLFIPYFLFQTIFAVVANRSGAISNFFEPIFGLWYLLALFIWRILMKDLIRVRYIFAISVVLNIVSVYFLTISNAFAANRILAFFVYFLGGYYLAEKRWSFKELDKGWKMLLVSLCLITEMMIFVAFYRAGWYNLLINMFCARLRYTEFESPVVAPLLHFVWLIVTFVNMWVLSFYLCKKNRILEHIGKDTMPIYISHIIVYLALVRFSSSMGIAGEWGIIVGCMCIVGSIILFSTDKYRKGFHWCIRKYQSILICDQK